MNTTTQSTTVTSQTASVQPTNVIQKDAVITNVVDQAVLGGVIEKQNVEVIHKPVVQEIHEQKIIELEKQNVLKNVQQGTVVQRATDQTRYEEVGSSDLEAERLRLAQLNAHGAPVVTQQSGSTHEVRQGEVVAQVIRQENIERHVQPVITEVREQNVVQEVLHPVVRKINEATIIREVGSSNAPLVQNNTQFSEHQSNQSFVTYEKTLLDHHTRLGPQFNHSEFVRTNPAPVGYVPTGLLNQHGLGHLTTTTVGGNAFTAERSNLAQHENKVLASGASNIERQNLLVHEQAVDRVVGHGVTGTTTGPIIGTTAPLGTANTIHGSTIEDEHKPGFMDKVKNALHLGGHKNQ